MFPPEALGEAPCLSNSWGLRVFLACGYVTPTSASVLTWPSSVSYLPLPPSFKDTCDHMGSPLGNPA